MSIILPTPEMRNTVDIERVCYEDCRFLLPPFLLYENTSPQIQSYQAIDCADGLLGVLGSGGRRSHRRFLARPVDQCGGRSHLPDVDRAGGL